MKFVDWILEDLKLDSKHDITSNSHVLRSNDLTDSFKKIKIVCVYIYTSLLTNNEGPF